MIEKRFILDDDGIVTDMVDLSIYIDNEDCCEKLNELADENKKLKDKLENGICPLCGARVSKCGGLQKYKGDLNG